MIKAGDKFKFKGFEWIALEINGDFVFSMMAKPWKILPFDVNSSNNWEKSSLRKVLSSELLPLIGKENLCEGMADLIADNGDTAYGNCSDSISILSCDEVREYREIIMKNYDFDDKLMWTLTPYIGSGNFVRYMNPTDRLGYESAACNYGVAPVCDINISALESEQANANDKGVSQADKILERIDCMRDCLSEIRDDLLEIEEAIKEGTE